MRVTRGYRAIQERRLADITAQKPTALPAGFKMPVYDEDVFYEGPYAELAKTLNRRLLEQAATTRDVRLLKLSLLPTVRFGQYALCKMLSYAPDAYQMYAAQKTESVSLGALGKILLRSAGVVNYFANADDRLAAIREVNFGLRASPPVHEENPFLIADESGLPRFMVSPVTAQATQLKIEQKIAEGALEAVAEDYRKCPAVGAVLTSQWELAVSRCVHEPQLFPHDLSTGVGGNYFTVPRF